jgi:hypothetical protein
MNRDTAVGLLGRLESRLLGMDSERAELAVVDP